MAHWERGLSLPVHGRSEPCQWSVSQVEQRRKWPAGNHGPGTGSGHERGPWGALCHRQRSRRWSRPSAEPGDRGCLGKSAHPCLRQPTLLWKRHRERPINEREGGKGNEERNIKCKYILACLNFLKKIMDFKVQLYWKHICGILFITTDTNLHCWLSKLAPQWTSKVFKASHCTRISVKRQ